MNLLLPFYYVWSSFVCVNNRNAKESILQFKTVSLQVHNDWPIFESICFLTPFCSTSISVRPFKVRNDFHCSFFSKNVLRNFRNALSCVVGVSQKVFTKAEKCVEALYTYRNNNRKVTGIQLPFTSCLRRTLPGFYFYDDEIKNVAQFSRVRPENFFDFGVYTVPINNVVL